MFFMCLDANIVVTKDILWDLAGSGAHGDMMLNWLSDGT